ncbi:PspA-associated protein PspAB [Amycolatopsis sp. NPDC003865]
MGFLDILLGRTKPVQPNLDVLFAIPSAAYTLQAALGFAPTGVGAVCFKAAEESASAHSQSDIRALLNLDPTVQVSVSHDRYGFTWITCRQSTVDLGALVTGLHAINSTLTDNGFGPTLLCTVVGFRGGEEQRPRRLGLVYLFKRGTVYPFAPSGEQRRDNALEMQVRAALGGELPVEADLERWFPIWDAPVP